MHLAILNKPVVQSSKNDFVQKQYTKPIPDNSKTEVTKPVATSEKSDDFNPFSDVAFNDNKKIGEAAIRSVTKSIDDIKVADISNPFDIFSKQAINKAKEEEKLKSTFKPEILQPTSLVEDEKTDTEGITDKNPIVSPKEVNVIVSEESIEKSKEPVLVNDNQTSIKYIGEAFDTYIIAEKTIKIFF